MPPDGSSANIMFLLSLSVVGPSCQGDDGDPNESAGTGGTGSNATPGTSGDTDDDGDDATQDAGASATAVDGGDGSTAESGTDGGGQGSSSAGDETSGTGGGLECTKRIPGVDKISRACVGYVEVLTECYGARISPECIAYEQAVCQYQVNYDTMLWGEECGAAYEELYACLSMLTCRELEGPRTSCGRQGMALISSCGG
jgi:hypothetical protein